MVKFQISATRALTVAMLMAGSAALSGCNGDNLPTKDSTGTTSTGTDSVATGSQNTQVAPQALKIDGTPSGTATVGVAYSFAPTTTGAEAGTVTYSISNKPSWATFNVSSGALAGTPTASDVGDFNAVTITATTGSQSATLASFRITVAAVNNQGSATLSWTPPTQNTDGSSVANLGGYNIYYGTSTTAMTNKIQVTNAGLTSYTVSGLNSGTHYFGISAYSSAGVESDLAIVGSKTIM